MPGGLLNLVSYGNQNIILNGNPSKTFFKSVYSKYTNFGLQKFRIDFEGLRNLRMTENSIFKFKVPRYADLLMDTYLVVTLPTIWSPILPPTSNEANSIDSIWKPYEFKWIKDLGTQMIESVKFTIGGITIQEYKGQYLKNLVERDFDANKKDIYDKMTGNIKELYDPANAFERNNHYPNVYPTNLDNYSVLGPEPSIRSRQLYIPLNIWFTLSSKMAFPLISLQYQELVIEVELKSIDKLYTIRNIEELVIPTTDISGLHTSAFSVGSHIKPNITNEKHQFYRFLQPPPWIGIPPNITLNSSNWVDRRTNWAADIHLISTYAFLSDDEINYFAAKNQTYLIKEVVYHKIENIYGSKKINLKNSSGMIANWMWYFQRNDVNLRNEWSNYTNWPYDKQPSGLIDPNGIIMDSSFNIIDKNAQDISFSNILINPSRNVDNTYNNFKITGNFNPENEKNIMQSWGLVIDGKYRENVLKPDILSYVEKYNKSNGSSSENLYCYNFCLSTNPFDMQPSGAMNFNKFKNVEFECTTILPSVNPNAITTFTTLPAPTPDDNPICVVNDIPQWGIYNYTYTLNIFEEKYNVLSFISGNANLMYAK
tara:strand:+ start:4498 stop:6288 length:1791 start_codon:yes stop_codon:yes gene_type:complete